MGIIEVVGVNTASPSRDLSIDGDMFISKKMYMGFDNVELETVNILKNSNIAFANNLDRLPILINSPSLTVYGGIVKADDYYIGDDRLVSLKKRENDGVLYSTDGNMSIGYLSDLYSCDNAALQVRNAIENSKYNNSVLRIYEANAYWENDNRYSGIEIAREPYNPEKGWYIHNIHDGTNRFVVGWKGGRGEDRKSLIDVVEFNDKHDLVLNNSSNDTTVIHGDVDIYGDLNVNGGKYKLNGLELTSNSISLSAYLDSEFNYELNELVTTDKDVMINGNRVMTFVGKNSSAFIGESTPYSVAYMNSHSRQYMNPYQFEPFDARLVVYQKHLEAYTDVQPSASFCVHPERGDHAISKIRLATLSDRVAPNGKHWDTNAHVDIVLDASASKTEYKLSMKPFKGVQQDVMTISNEGDNLYYRLGRGDIRNSDVKPFIHIYNENDIALYLENKNQNAKMRLNTWEISCGDVFEVSNKDNGKTMMYVDVNNNIGINMGVPEYTLDVDRVDKNNEGCMRLKNTYRSNAEDDEEMTLSVMLCNMDTPSIVFDDNEWRINLTRYFGELGDNSYPKVVEYRCNITVSIPYSVDVYNLNVDDYKIWNTVGIGVVDYVVGGGERLLYSNVFNLSAMDDVHVPYVRRDLDTFETDRVVLSAEYYGVDVPLNHVMYSNVSNLVSPDRDIWYYYSELYLGTSNVDTEWVLANEEKNVSIDVDGVGEIMLYGECIILLDMY